MLSALLTMKLDKALLAVTIFFTCLHIIEVSGTCDEALGMEDKTVANSDITASSEYDSNHAARLGRLKQLGRPGWAGAWCAKYNDLEQWFQVDFTNAVKITGVATQGRQDNSQWVKKFTLGYSQDGEYFEPYIQNGQKQLFHGNKDKNSIVRHVLQPPIVASYVRIYPIAWHNHISMRAEFYGCREGCSKGGFDFEKGPRSLTNWKMVGDAFRNQPTYGDNPTVRNRRQPSNHEGKYWIGGFENRPTPQSKPGVIVGDRPQGTLSSPTFLITGSSIKFLVGGGCHIESVRVELVVADKVVRRATGKCTETMERRYWNTTSFIGNKAYVMLVDRSSGGWGHINFDDFGGDIQFCEGFIAPPKPLCGKALGMQDGRITDAMMSSSSEWSRVCRPGNARLYFRNQHGRVGAWCTRRNDQRQYLQINLKRWAKITRVSVQGRYDLNQWVRKYSIEYSYDCAKFQQYKLNGHKVIFRGNTDRHSIVSSKLKPPVVARCIKIHPVSWYFHISMRVELYGCYSGFNPPS